MKNPYLDLANFIVGTVFTRRELNTLTDDVYEKAKVDYTNSVSKSGCDDLPSFEDAIMNHTKKEGGSL
jgi:hypothetical protein